MKGIAAALLLLLSGSAFAQCINSDPATPTWPDTISFQPANPAPGQPVTATLGPPTSWYLIPTIQVSGSVVTVSGQLDLFPGVPPPPSPLRIQLGSLPAGVYTVRMRLTGIGPTPVCNPLDATLVVGGVNTVGSVPSSSALSLAVLLALVALVGWRTLARIRR
jgi:hypothetical protein